MLSCIREVDISMVWPRWGKLRGSCSSAQKRKLESFNLGGSNRADMQQRSSNLLRSNHGIYLSPDLHDRLGRGLDCILLGKPPADIEKRED